MNIAIYQLLLLGYSRLGTKEACIPKTAMLWTALILSFACKSCSFDSITLHKKHSCLGLTTAAEVTIFYPNLDPGVSGTVSIIGAGSDGRTTYAIVPAPTDTLDVRKYAPNYILKINFLLLVSLFQLSLLSRDQQIS